MDFMLLIAATVIPPGAILGGTVRAWRTWTVRWRLSLLLPGVFSIAAIATILSAPLTKTEAGAFSFYSPKAETQARRVDRTANDGESAAR